MADILIIDDDAGLRVALQMALRRKHHDCRLAGNMEQGYAEWSHRSPDLTLLDLRLPDGSGLELLNRMNEQGIQCPVIVMTAFGSVASAVTAMKRGAVEFIEKPPSVNEVCDLVTQTLDERNLLNQVAATSGTGDQGVPFTPVGRCDEMRRVIAKAEQIANVPCNGQMEVVSVLVTGETGTGKEMLARYIHQQSGLSQNSFTVVSAARISEFMVTSADKVPSEDIDSKTTGLGEQALPSSGTLFLDEIGDAPLSAQADLLAFLSSDVTRSEVRTGERDGSLRIVASTHRRLDELVDAGSFRPDLYHHLRMFHIHLPPVRDRGDDLFLLAEHFLGNMSRKLGSDVPKLSDEARDRLRMYSWPGNVRELLYSMIRAITLTQGSVIPADALDLREEVAEDHHSGADSLSFDFSKGRLSLDELERRLIRAAFEHARGNVSETARLLGMPRGTLRYRLEKMGLTQQL